MKATIAIDQAFCSRTLFQRLIKSKEWSEDLPNVSISIEYLSSHDSNEGVNLEE